MTLTVILHAGWWKRGASAESWTDSDLISQKSLGSYKNIWGPGHTAFICPTSRAWPSLKRLQNACASAVNQAAWQNHWASNNKDNAESVRERKQEMESSWRQGSETITLHILHSNFGGMLRMRVTLHCKRDCCLHPASCVQTLHLSPDLRLQESWNGHEESFHPCLAVAFNLSSASFLQEYYVISINSGLNEY